MIRNSIIQPTFSKKPLKRKPDYIICNGEKVFVEDAKIITWLEDPFFAAPRQNMRIRKNRKPNLFINHWDVCASSAMCHKVVKKRGLSVHFMVDNDGTIYQTMDTSNIAWHCRGVNTWSIGVEISNMIDIKKQPYYEGFVGKPRPIMSGAEVHGKVLKDFLWFYPEQVEALKKLWAAIHEYYKIPYLAPTASDGSLITTVIPKAKRFHGFACHYHVNAQKPDCAGMNLIQLLSEIT